MRMTSTLLTLKPNSLVSFNGDDVSAKGEVVLFFNVRLVTLMVKFLFVDIAFLYNIILGKSCIHYHKRCCSQPLARLWRF